MFFSVSILLSLELPLVTSIYSFQCPAKEQWTLRSKSVCNQSYFCLLNWNTYVYEEQCRKTPSWDTPGYRRVFAGGLHGIKCSEERFQPFMFSTEGNSDCVYQKSNCHEEGLVVHDDGSNEVDRKCRCDYRQGYDFVVKPKHGCYCVPSEDDCSCYIKRCQPQQLLTPDYECRYLTDWKTSFKCPQLPVDNPVTTTSVELLVDNSKAAKPTTSTTSAQLLVLSVLAAILLLLFTWILITFVRAKCHKRTYDAVQRERLLSIKDQSIQQRKLWRRQLDRFVPTRASKQTLDEVLRHQFVIITGPPGSGKSLIAVNCIMELMDLYEYSYIHLHNSSDILKQDYLAGKQVIFLDDIFGKFSLNETNICWWKREGEEIKTTLHKNGDFKIIATCRSFLFYTDGNDALTDLPLRIINLASEDKRLNVQERRAIGEVYIGSKISELSDETLLMYEFFSDLSSHVGPNATVQDFTRPYKYLANEIEQDYEHLKTKFLVLSICVILNNAIKENFFERKNDLDEKKIEFLSKEIHLSPVPSKERLLQFVNALEDAYFLKNNSIYQFKSEELFELILSAVSKYILRSLLRYGKVAVLKDRVKLVSLKHVTQPSVNNVEQHAIEIPQELEKQYFERMLMDMTAGLHLEVLMDKQNKQTEFREKFVEYFKNIKNTDVLKRIVEDKHILNTVADLGYKEYVQYFADIERSCVNHVDDKGKSPLHLAAAKGHTLVANELVKRGARYDLPDKEGNTPIYIACAKGFTDTVKALLSDKTTVNSSSESLLLPFHLVCKNNNKHIAALLLAENVDLNVPDKNGFYPLHTVSKKGHTEICKLLLQHQVDVNCVDRHGRTALHHACMNKHVTVVKLLLSKEADTNIVDDVKHLPLHIACQNGSKEIANELVKLVVEIDSKNASGRTPLFLASDSGSIKIVQTLLTRKANVNLCDIEENSPLHIASKEGHHDVVNYLINEHADVNRQNILGQTPLFVASESDQKDIVETLLLNGALATIRDKTLLSPLHVACIQGNTETVKLLSKYCKTLIHQKDIYGKSPMQIVKENGNKELEDILSAVEEKQKGQHM